MRRPTVLWEPGAVPRCLATPGLAGVVVLLAAAGCTPSFEGYATRGDRIVDRATGAPVHLIGFGLGGWLLPEGYMWGKIGRAHV